MSLRINLSTFDLSKLQGLLGSGDESAIDAIDRKLLNLKDSHELEPHEYRAARKALEKAIRRGTPIGLRHERPCHVELANLLAEYRQRHHGLACDYKYFGTEAFWNRYRNEFDLPARTSFDTLIKGRPLFGRSFARETGSYYGFLDHNEVVQLVAGLKSLLEAQRGNAEVEEVAGGYVECLKGIGRSRRDVWIHAG